MPVVTTTLPHGKIMVVDDTPANLKLLEDMLRQKGYEVRSFPRGRQALAAAAENPPDVILLDVNMPEMNGYEVCKRLKLKEELSNIPVLFISALNETADKVKAFHSGGVDYIAKPFQLEEVQARVETHVKLRRAKQVEQDLLEQTLNGTIRMLSALVHTGSPWLASRSEAIRACARWITTEMSLADAWQYDLAAMLSLIGCLTLPEEIFQKGYSGEILSPEEDAIFRAHPESGARLLSNIPRLEFIAQMIRMQLRSDVDPGASEQTQLGSRMLFLAIELDRRIYRGVSFPAALQQMRSSPGRFDPAMVAALRNYSPASSDFHRAAVPIRQLFAGMALDDDVVSKTSGLLIFPKDTILTETWIERLKNFAKLGGVKEPVRVRIPGLAAAPVIFSKTSPM
jgi:CheY-like chemotaxis protein